MPAGSFAAMRRPWWIWDVAVTAAALLGLLAWDATGADLLVVQWFGSPQGFAWRDRWLTAQLLHTGGRWLGIAVMLALLFTLFRPVKKATRPAVAQAASGAARRLPLATRLWWVGTTIGCLVLIPAIKARSLVSCPWDLAPFGGAAQYLPHWAAQAWAGVGDGGPGRCFPSGHASAAFSFLAGWFVLRGVAPRAARLWLTGVLVMGVLFGVAQVARGAHYPSHVAWTAWICWAFSVAAWHAFRGLIRATLVAAGAAEPLAP